MANGQSVKINVTYRVSDLIDAANQSLEALGTARSPLMVDGVVSYNASTAKFDQLYISLCQYSDPESVVGKPIAKIEAVIFRNHLQTIERDLKGLNMSLKPDLRAVFYGYLDIYKPFGKLQLRITGVDIVRTKQVTEGAKDLLRRKLKLENFFDNNRLLKMPTVPLRIALVTSRGSAAESDFMTKLNLDRFAFHVTMFYVNTSGQNVAISIPEAFQMIERRASEFDVVVLARGGGDHVDLASFSLEGPVRAVVGCSVPVWSAIGHSTDDVLVNEVANRILANPNDAAAQLNDILDNFRMALDSRQRQLTEAATARIRDVEIKFRNTKLMVLSASVRALGQFRRIPSEKREDLFAHASRVIEASRRQLDGSKGRLRQRSDDMVTNGRTQVDRYKDIGRLCDLDNLVERFSIDLRRLADRLQMASRSVVDVAEKDLVVLESRVDSFDPVRIMAHGYALLSKDGDIVKSVKHVLVGDMLTVAISDGELAAAVTDVTQRTS